MYIHSYQIHNVLNVYRKQLCQCTAGTPGGNASRSSSATDRINISSEGQRQTIFEKISATIVERITQSEPQTPFEAPLADRLGQSPDAPLADKEWQSSNTVLQDANFTYTVIDEHDQKRINTLAVRPFDPGADTTESLTGGQQDDGVTPETD